MSDIKPFLVPPPEDAIAQQQEVLRKLDFDKMFPITCFIVEGIKNFIPYTPLQEWADTYHKTFTPIQEMFKDTRASVMASVLNNTSVFSSYFENLIPPDTLYSIRNCGAFSSEQFRSVVEPFTSSLPINHDFNESDYVTVDEAPIKELCIPDTLAIPIGNCRVRIRTDIFVNIIGILIAAIVTMIFSTSPSNSIKPDNVDLNTHQMQTQLLLWQNNTLRPLLISLDVSASSQAESLQSLCEAVEGLKESVDLLRKSVDNMSESESTESEQ